MVSIASPSSPPLSEQIKATFSGDVPGLAVLPSSPDKARFGANAQTYQQQQQPMIFPPQYGASFYGASTAHLGLNPNAYSPPLSQRSVSNGSSQGGGIGGGVNNGQWSPTLQTNGMPWNGNTFMPPQMQAHQQQQQQQAQQGWYGLTPQLGGASSPSASSADVSPSAYFNGGSYFGGAPANVGNGYAANGLGAGNGPVSPGGDWNQATIMAAAALHQQQQQMVAAGLMPASVLQMPPSPGAAGPNGAAAANFSALVAAASGAGATGRTVYLGNLPSDASVDELLNQVRFGPIESVKILPEKSCAFISFLDAHTASAFHSDALMRKISLHDVDLKIGWGKPSPVPAAVVQAVQQGGATRNVYLGSLDPNETEQGLRDDLARYGPIDQVKIVRDKNIGFVHFLSISTAIKVVATLPTKPEWQGRRVNYGKDRCAYVPKNQHQQQQHNLQAAHMAAHFTGGAGVVGANLAAYGQSIAAMNGGVMPQGFQADPNAGNRTVYLGSIHPETTVEEICNAIRGGILQQIRYIPDKHICFVTFIDPNAALAFMATASVHGVNIHQRRLKVGWGKHPGAPPPGIAMVVQAGGSRNIYIGNLSDFEVFSEDRLREDFGVYGDIELVNLLREKNCAFVNFTQISYAIKALEGMKSNPDYATFKIAYGKDRCGNAPRGGYGGMPAQRSSSGGAGPAAAPTSAANGNAFAHTPFSQAQLVAQYYAAYGGMSAPAMEQDFSNGSANEPSYIHSNGGLRLGDVREEDERSNMGSLVHSPALVAV